MKFILCSVFLISGAIVQAAPVLLENFNNVAGLTGSGWTITNRSNPVGTSTWEQGNLIGFNPSGAADANYAAVAYTTADIGGVASNWLITPVVTLDDGYTISFWTRSNGIDFEDSLEVRLNPSGTTNVGPDENSVGDFSVVLLAINPLFDGSYPTEWTYYQFGVVGLGGPTNATVAFRYFVPDTDLEGDYIGIDTLSIDSTPIPEPGTWALGLGALSFIAALRGRRS